jgi:hypothetical protein
MLGGDVIVNLLAEFMIGGVSNADFGGLPPNGLINGVGHVKDAVAAIHQQDQASASLGKFMGNCFADPASCSGDHGDLILDVHNDPPFSQTIRSLKLQEAPPQVCKQMKRHSACVADAVCSNHLAGQGFCRLCRTGCTRQSLCRQCAEAARALSRFRTVMALIRGLPAWRRALRLARFFVLARRKEYSQGTNREG